MYRVRNIIFPRGAAQTTNDVELNYMQNESSLKMGYMSIAENT
jgi:hypothetical protein